MQSFLRLHGLLLVALIEHIYAEKTDENICSPTDDSCVSELSLLRLRALPNPAANVSSQDSGPNVDQVFKFNLDPFLNESMKVLLADAFQRVNNHSSFGQWPLFGSPQQETPLAFLDFIEKDRDRVLVASAPLELSVMSIPFHPYDVALYLSRESPLWGQPAISNREVLDNAKLGTVVFRTSTRIPTFMPMFALKSVMKAIALPFVYEEHADPAELDRLADLQFGAGKVPEGTDTVVRMDPKGLEVFIYGESQGRLNSMNLATASVKFCMSPESPIKGFSELVISKLMSAKVTPQGRTNLHSQSGGES